MKPIFEKATAVAFIGNKPEGFISVIPAPASQEQEIKNQLFLTVHDLYRKGFRTFICCMDSIFELWIAQIVCIMKECLPYRDIRLAAAIPFPGHAKHFTQDCLSLYGQFMKQVDYFIPPIMQEHGHGCFLRHNLRLLEHCSLAICCFDDRNEKAKYILDKARSRGIAVINIYDHISE